MFTKLKDNLKEVCILKEQIQKNYEDIQRLDEMANNKKIEVEEASKQLLEKFKREIIPVEERVKQYKDKIAELHKLKQTLSDLNQEIKQKDNEISNIKQILKQAKEKIIITADSELIAQQYRTLTLKNQELKKGLDYHAKHKNTLEETYESINKKK